MALLFLYNILSQVHNRSNKAFEPKFNQKIIASTLAIISQTLRYKLAPSSLHQYKTSLVPLQFQTDDGISFHRNVFKMIANIFAITFILPNILFKYDLPENKSCPRNLEDLILRQDGGRQTSYCGHLLGQ